MSRPTAGAWTQLRALMVAFHPGSVSQLEGIELAPNARTISVAKRWIEEGTGQLTSLLVAGHHPATIMNQVARYLLTMPSSPRRERLVAGMLRDVAGLA